MATLRNTTINDTGFLQIPVGTTQQRPAQPTLAMIRYNTTEVAMEVYDGTEWIAISTAVSGLTVTGGTITTAGGYTIHTFTSSGTLTIAAG